jgi:hypothetical protein
MKTCNNKIKNFLPINKSKIIKQFYKMATALVSALSKLASAIPGGQSLKQPFANVHPNYNNDLAIGIASMSGGQLLTFIIVFVLSVWLLMFLGAWVFNTSIPQIIPGIKKITMLEFFGLYIICHILFT